MDWESMSDTEIEDDLPEQITVIKAVSYDVQAVVRQMVEEGHYEDPSLGDVMSFLVPSALSEFGCEWGHPTGLETLKFYDEYGIEIVISNKDA